jgi:tRNA pseudouridine55 synthase
MKPQLYHGLLVIDKPGGMTSRTAINQVQRWFPRGTRVGHTGTLDPLATGVLVVCLGTATRLAEYVQDMPKTYRASLLFGARSDTDDLEGTVTQAEVKKSPDLAAVKAALPNFVGDTEQIPPSYSAAKIAGRRAYDLARRGREVMLQPRKIKIYGIEVVSFDYPRVEIEVRCGKGTYIRSLARDLGKQLGCGALIESLRRTGVGPFGEKDAVSLDVGSAVAHGRILPLAAAIAELPKVVVDQDCERDLQQGRAVTFAVKHEFNNACGNPTCAVLAKNGRLVAIGTWDASKHRLRPSKVISET